MNEHTLGSLLDDQRGAWGGKDYFPSPPFWSYLEVVGSNCKTVMKLFTNKFVSKRWIFVHLCQLSNQIFAPCSFCVVSHLTLSSFLPSSSSISRQESHRTNSFNLSFLSQSTPRDLVMGAHPYPLTTNQCIDPIPSSRPNAHHIKIICVLYRQQSVGQSAVKPTWLPCSNGGASLRRNEQLKDQLKESG